MKTALSQAMKRCAVNLGDGFGLSLYNDGSRDAVVCWSAAHPPAGAAGRPAIVPDVPEDTPVRGEQTPQASPTAEPERPGPVEQQPPQIDERTAAEAEMRAAAAAVGFTDGLEAQFQYSFGHSTAKGTIAEFRQARDLLRGSAA